MHKSFKTNMMLVSKFVNECGKYSVKMYLMILKQIFHESFSSSNLFINFRL